MPSGKRIAIEVPVDLTEGEAFHVMREVGNIYLELQRRRPQLAVPALVIPGR
jgi:hypothetical protein